MSIVPRDVLALLGHDPAQQPLTEDQMTRTLSVLNRHRADGLVEQVPVAGEVDRPRTAIPADQEDRSAYRVSAPSARADGAGHDTRRGAGDGSGDPSQDLATPPLGPPPGGGRRPQTSGITASNGQVVHPEADDDVLRGRPPPWHR